MRRYKPPVTRSLLTVPMFLPLGWERQPWRKVDDKDGTVSILERLTLPANCT